MSGKWRRWGLLPLLLVPQLVLAAELKQKTIDAFDRYVRQAEARIQGRIDGCGSFLWLDAAQDRRARVRNGRVVIGHFGDSAMISVPDGLIHHWIGACLIPGATLEQTLALIEDYDNHQRYYGPEVQKSKLLSRNGNDFRIYYRLRKKKVITVILDTEHDVRYFQLGDKRAHSRSYSTKIAEVEDAGKPDERELPAGDDHGFLWRLYSYWRLLERDGGVYIECEAISLTRGIPTGAGWLVKPIIRDLPRESLTATLENTRAALENLPRSAAQNRPARAPDGAAW